MADYGEGLLPAAKEAGRVGSITLYLLFCTVAALVPSFHFGLQISLMNVPGAVIQADLGIKDKTVFDFSTSVLPIGGLVGALFLAPRLADAIGRRGFFLASAPLFIVGGALMTAAWWVRASSGMAAFVMIVCGRFISGVGVGSGSVVSPMYLSEIAPTRYRGAFGAMVQFAVTAGILVVEVLGVAVGPGWVWLFVISTALGVLQLVLAFFASRSPAFVAARGDREAAARCVRVLQSVDPAAADGIVDGLSAKRAEGDDAAPPLLSLLRSKVFFFPLVLCMLLQVAQQLSGINAVFFFSTKVFNAAGIDANTGSLVAAGVNIAATGLAVAVVELAGRRLLLLLSTVGMMLSAAGLTACLVLLQDGDKSLATPAIVCVALYVTFFELGLGPIPWMIGAEIFPERPRATAMSAAAAVNYIFTFVVAQGFGAMQGALGVWSFAPFVGVLSAFLVYFLAVLPETKGRMPEQVLASMGLDLSAEPGLAAADEDALAKSLAFDESIGLPRGASVNPGGRFDGDESGGSDLYFGDA